MLPTTEAPFPSFFDLDGSPLDEGKVYYGVANTNPVTSPLPIFWDGASTQPATQPISTIAGYTVRFGTPANVYTDQPYSISVYDKKGRLVYTHPDSSQYNDAANISSITNNSYGSALVGYLPPWTGAVGRTLSNRMQETVSACDFGLRTTNTGAQNNTAMAAAIAYAVSQGGLTIHVPRGDYDFSTSIDLSAANNTRLTGDGIDATVLRITHATDNFLLVSGIYQTIDNLTLTSSVTRTAGAMIFGTTYWQRGLIDRVKVTRHFNGINIRSFEECYIQFTSVVDPSGAGSGMIFGEPSAVNLGANMTLISCFIRGNNDVAPSAVVGLYGIYLYDIQAIYAVSCDVGGVNNNPLVIEPQTACENCFFLQCYFDATVAGENVIAVGTGLKRAFTFNGCWFASAGRIVLPGVADITGVRLTSAGSYADWNIIGCRFIASSGPGLAVETADADITVTGCVFVSCAANTGLRPTSIYVNPPASQVNPMLIAGCKFSPVGSSTSDIHFVNSLCIGNTISGCVMPKSISYASGATFGSVAGVSDGSTDSVASAATLKLPSPSRSYYYVTGTTNVGGLFRTYTGHVVSFKAVSGFTWLNGGALDLKGGANFVAAAGDVLTLVCRADGTWQEVSRSA